MAIMLANSWRLEALKRQVDISSGAPVQARLFTNNRTPAATDALTDYTEASGGGYAAQQIDSGDWEAVEASPSELSASVTFEFTGPLAGAAQAYGVYLTSGGKLVGAERFAGPANITGPQTPVHLSPVTLRN